MTTPHPRDLLPGIDKLRPFGDLTRIDVTQPPYNADPTGQRDSTASLVRAMDHLVSVTADAMNEAIREIEALPGDGYLPSGKENRKQGGQVIGIFPTYLPYLPALYLPAGVYRITDTVSYTRTDLCNTLGSELNRQIRILGDGPGRTILRVPDHCPQFAGGAGKPVLSLMRGKRSNVAMMNYVEELSIEVGAGNPAAIGLDFFASNTGAVRDVTIRSADTRARCGLLLGHQNPTGVLLDHVEIEGFAVGVDVTSYVTGEHLKLRGQSDAGIVARACYLSLREVDYDGSGTAVRLTDPQGSVAILDSRLKGSGPHAVDYSVGALYLSQTSIEGFEAAVAHPSSEAMINGEPGNLNIQELVLPRIFTMPDTTERMKRLPVEYAPRFAPKSGERRCGVREFGAVGDSHHDDSPALQAALDSGAAVIEFEPGHYRMESPVKIPPQVRRICFNCCDLVAGEKLANLADQGAFVITGETDEPLFLEKLFAWELWRGDFHMFDHASRRTVVIRDIHAQLCPLYKNSVSGGKVFIDNICCTTGVIPGKKGHGRCCLTFNGQQVWSRQLNPERGEPMVMNDGGRLWVLGFKTEDAGVAWYTQNGGSSEIVGGNLFSGRPYATACVQDNSEARITGSTSGGEVQGYYGTGIEERRDGKTQTLKAEVFPLRHGPPQRGPQYHIPLYASQALKRS